MPAKAFPEPSSRNCARRICNSKRRYASATPTSRCWSNRRRPTPPNSKAYARSPKSERTAGRGAAPSSGLGDFHGAREFGHRKDFDLDGLAQPRAVTIDEPRDVLLDEVEFHGVSPGRARRLDRQQETARPERRNRSGERSLARAEFDHFAALAV